MLIDFVRMVKAASEGFVMGDDFEFIKFEDFTDAQISETQASPEHIEIVAQIKVPFTGTPPDSYKVLNLMISDWEEKNLAKLTDIIHSHLRQHIGKHYPGSDHTALENLSETAIWTDQIDFMPDIDEDKKFMLIDIDLVLEGEPIQ